MKDGARVINCARGELIDTSALEAGILSGKIGGAALDVYEREPPGNSPLLAHANVVATPHIGGSTEEAQEKVGIVIAIQVRDFLLSGVVINAVNTPSVSAEQYGRIAPYLRLSERIGSFLAQTTIGRPVRVKITYSGDFGENRPDHDAERRTQWNAELLPFTEGKSGECLASGESAGDRC